MSSEDKEKPTPPIKKFFFDFGDIEESDWGKLRESFRMEESSSEDYEYELEEAIQIQSDKQQKEPQKPKVPQKSKELKASAEENSSFLSDESDENVRKMLQEQKSQKILVLQPKMHTCNLKKLRKKYKRRGRQNSQFKNQFLDSYSYSEYSDKEQGESMFSSQESASPFHRLIGYHRQPGRPKLKKYFDFEEETGFQKKQVNQLKIRIKKILGQSPSRFSRHFNKNVDLMGSRALIYLELTKLFIEQFPELKDKILSACFQTARLNPKREQPTIEEISEAALINDHYSRGKGLEDIIDENIQQWTDYNGGPFVGQRNRMLGSFVRQVLTEMNYGEPIIVNQVSERLYHCFKKISQEKDRDKNSAVKEKNKSSLKRRVYDCVNIYSELGLIRKLSSRELTPCPKFLDKAYRLKCKRSFQDKILGLIKIQKQKIKEIQGQIYLAKRKRKIIQCIRERSMQMSQAHEKQELIYLPIQFYFKGESCGSFIYNESHLDEDNEFLREDQEEKAQHTKVIRGVKKIDEETTQQMLMNGLSIKYYVMKSFKVILKQKLEEDHTYKPIIGRGRPRRNFSFQPVEEYRVAKGLTFEQQLQEEEEEVSCMILRSKKK